LPLTSEFCSCRRERWKVTKNIFCQCFVFKTTSSFQKDNGMQNILSLLLELIWKVQNILYNSLAIMILFLLFL
jgi:hypothetical protein